MNHHRIGIILILVMLLIGIVAYPMLPEIVPTHYGIDGMPNNFGPRWIAAFMAPLASLLIFVLFEYLPRLDPMTRRDPQRFSYESFRPTLQRWSTAFLLFILLTHIVQLLGVFGYHGETFRILFGGIGLLFAALGNEMGRLRPNSFAGIRVPWLMNDDAAWRLAHRWAGRAFVIGGVAALLCAITLPMKIASVAALVCIGGATVVTLVGSYAAALRTGRKA